MRIRWRGLELPSNVVRDDSVSTDTYGRFIVEPFERGFGTTVGNSLRRILLSSLEGAAATKVKILEAPHEFTTIPGILEDATDIILNVKSIVVKSTSDEPKTMKVSRSTPGEVRAGDIEADASLEVVNRDLVICTITGDGSFNMEATVKKGRGYATADENRIGEDEAGVIPVDSVYSPVLRVRYKTEDTRVGQKTNYDRLVMEIWTRGTISPDDALVEAAKILRKHLNPFLMDKDPGVDTVPESFLPAVDQPVGGVVDAELQKKREAPIAILNLSVRASNCLESARIGTVGLLASKTEAELLRLRSFGKTSLREIRRKLADLGLGLGGGTDRGSGYGDSSDSGNDDGGDDNTDDSGGAGTLPPDSMSVPVEQNN